MSLIDTVYHEEKENNTGLSRTPLLEWRSHCWPLLASVPIEVLRTLLDGSLVYQLISLRDSQTCHCVDAEQSKEE
jgi:hypothetical protein